MKKQWTKLQTRPLYKKKNSNFIRYKLEIIKNKKYKTSRVFFHT